MITGKKIAVAGAVLSALAVGLGAFGAHALGDTLAPNGLAAFRTAVSYMQGHALAMIVSGLLFVQWKDRFIRLAGIGFFLGILLFSGSLLVLVLTEVAFFGAITPIGGVILIGSWIALATGLLRSDAADRP